MSDRKTDVEKIEEVAEDVKNKLPEYVKHISARRAKLFLQILKDIGISEIVNEVISDNSGQEDMLKPITADAQTSRILLNTQTNMLAKKLAGIQLKFDFGRMTELLLEGDNMERMIAVVLDTKKPEEANFADFVDALPFFLLRFSTAYSALVSFMTRLA